jgi:hypothetical protein
MLKYDKNWIVWFNKNKNKKLYSEILNLNFPDNKKCIICNDVIYYEKSIFRISKDGILYPDNKSYLSKKNIFGNDYYLSVCEDCMKSKYPEYENINKNKIFNRICEMSCFAFQIPDDVSEKWKKENYSITEENLIKKHGIELGKMKWNKYCEKQSLSNTFEYKKEKHGWNKKKFKEYNKSRATTLKNCIIKHGKEKGTKIWNSYIEKQRYTCSKDYFIKKYGYIDGMNKYNNFSDKRMFKFGFSDISQRLFKLIDDKLNNKYTIYYSIKNKEYRIDDDLKSYYLDFYIKELNIAIEFNGDLWHANPELYNENDTPHPFQKKLKSKDIWKLDKERYDFIKTKVDDIIIVWENDIKNKGIKNISDELVYKIETYNLNYE